MFFCANLCYLSFSLHLADDAQEKKYRCFRALRSDITFGCVLASHQPAVDLPSRTMDRQVEMRGRCQSPLMSLLPWKLGLLSSATRSVLLRIASVHCREQNRQSKESDRQMEADTYKQFICSSATCVQACVCSCMGAHLCEGNTTGMTSNVILELSGGSTAVRFGQGQEEGS